MLHPALIPVIWCLALLLCQHLIYSSISLLELSPKVQPSHVLCPLYTYEVFEPMLMKPQLLRRRLG